MMTDTIAHILLWYNSKTQPTERRAFNVCPICQMTWYPGEPAKHERTCWIPELEREACREDEAAGLKAEVERLRRVYAIFEEMAPPDLPRDMFARACFAAWEGMDAKNARIDLLREALEAVEWVREDGYPEYCPWCDNGQFEGHRTDCVRQLTLAVVKD